MGRERIILRGVEETIAFGRLWALDLEPGDVVALRGDLGTGKTHLAKGIALGLGLASARELQSPTFLKLAIYETKPTLFHFDLYRIRCSEEFIALGFEEFLDQGGVTLIEWPERIETLLPVRTRSISLSYGEGEEERIAEFFSN